MSAILAAVADAREVNTSLGARVWSWAGSAAVASDGAHGTPRGFQLTGCVGPLRVRPPPPPNRITDRLVRMIRIRDDRCSRCRISLAVAAVDRDLGVASL